MPSPHFEFCIIGQGLAGTTLAWMLKSRNKSVLVLDRNEMVTSSRIAAGLLTPITGPKLASTGYWDDCRDRAEAFYQQIEQLTGNRFFRTQPAAHLLRSEAEQQLFQTRIQSPAFQQLACPLGPADRNPYWLAPWGAFEMPTAAQLDVARYLDCSREIFVRTESLLQTEFSPFADLKVTPETLRFPRLGFTADHLIFCQGYQPDLSPWFDAVQFRPAKGEILTLRIPELRENRSAHSGCWLAPFPTFQTGAAPLNDLYILGSTFEWKVLDCIPTTTASEQLLTQLRCWLNCPVEVIRQQAAVRPTMKDFQPVLGIHPQEPRIGILNGLGTRGSLMAPWLAELLMNHLELQTPLPPQLDVQRWFP